MHLHVCLWVDLCLTCRGVDVDGDLIGGSVLIYSLLERSPPYLFYLKGSFSMAAPVSPITFSQRMEQHWVETLGNASSENLREIWKQLGAAFGQAIVSHGKPEGSTWRVLQPPTGTGKTQGLCLYGAMLAEQNEKLESLDRFGPLSHSRLKFYDFRQTPISIRKLNCNEPGGARQIKIRRSFNGIRIKWITVRKLQSLV